MVEEEEVKVDYEAILDVALKGLDDLTKGATQQECVETNAQEALLNISVTDTLSEIANDKSINEESFELVSLIDTSEGSAWKNWTEE